MKLLATLRLPFPVSTNNLYQRQPHGGYGDRFPTAELKAWKKAAGLLLNTQRPPRILERVEIHIDLDDRRQGDCDNRVKCVVDLLVEQQIIKSDRKRFVKRISSGWESTESDICIVRIYRAAADGFQFGEKDENDQTAKHHPPSMAIKNYGCME